MARIPRSVALPEYGIFHVTQRGVDGCPIVRDDDDREAFVHRRAEVELRFEWKTFAWCLLDNHFHLVVETWRKALSDGMHRLGFMHAQRFNNRHDRYGHLFQSRFRARLVTPDDDEELENVGAYVYANAVRHGLCRLTEDWPWHGRPAPGRRARRAVHRGEDDGPGADRRGLAAPAVRLPVAERVLGLHQLVDLRRPLVDERGPGVADAPFARVPGGVAVGAVLVAEHHLRDQVLGIEPAVDVAPRGRDP
jgi:REP element-mobilizing transposase RayT